MTWVENVPRGDLLPRDERPRFAGNWEYIRTELRDDHFWDEDANHDGHHRKVEMTNISDTGVGLTTNDPTDLSTSVEGMFYVRPKTAGQSPDKQISEPFFMAKDGANRIISQLGIRAMIHFEVDGGTFAITTGYAHNCSVARSAVGLYTITFDVALPTDNYIVLGSSLRSADSGLTVSIQSGTKAARITTADVDIAFSSTNAGNLRDPLVAMIAIVGG